jgi:nicotinate-nucleotide pyrophosphorylase (carboxylating)
MMHDGNEGRCFDVAIDSLSEAAAEEAVARALAEDRAAEDATTLATVAGDLDGMATFIAKADGVLAGLSLARFAFATFDGRPQFDVRVGEGQPFRAGDVLATVEGNVRAILQAERVALNFLQRLSGIATLTRRFVDAVEGTGAVILDTRKTTPGLRALEKYAVRCGGGTNHRGDLAEMAMIKDNHREALAREGRSLADGVRAIRQMTPGIPVEVEIDALDELEAALEGQPEWVLLDNMSPATMREAVGRTAGRAKLEASGGVTLDTVRAIAESGVDAVSVGALTHSAVALDIGLDLAF